jgi:probable HAF family extracellular repeat protein
MTIVLISLGVGQMPVAQGGVVTFTPIDFPDAKETIPLDINDVGEIVGRYEDATGKTHGFLLSAGNFTSIDFPHPNVAFTVAAGINTRGDIVGQYRLAGEDENTVRHGFLSQGGTFTTINFPNASWTNILGINPRGDMVGRYCLKPTSPTLQPLCAPGQGKAHGFLRSMQGGFASIDFPNARETHAWKINARGQIVGNYQDGTGKFHVYLHGQGDFTSIDFPKVVAVSTSANSGSGGINSRGDIVSEYCSKPCPSPDTHTHGFLRSTRGGFASIDFPHAVRTVALGINTRGDIVGLYNDTDNNIHGFLLSQYERDGDEDER